MTTTASDKITAWLNVSKSSLKAGQTEQLTIEFSQDVDFHQELTRDFH